jgi:hypothetical protein
MELSQMKKSKWPKKKKKKRRRRRRNAQHPKP